jgi:Barstar (barnase inhibitor)
MGGRPDASRDQPIASVITGGHWLGRVESVPVVEVPMSQINDWDTFHDTFAQALGFPDFYGRNMDAWIDCLTYADEARRRPGGGRR